MTYAIVECGNKQYKIKKGSVIDVELLDKNKNDLLEINTILLASDGKDVKIGTPYVKSALIKCRVLDNIKDKKVVVFKYKSKSNYHKKTGHRQKYTRLVVEDIAL